MHRSDGRQLCILAQELVQMMPVLTFIYFVFITLLRSDRSGDILYIVGSILNYTVYSIPPDLQFPFPGFQLSARQVMG